MDDGTYQVEETGNPVGERRTQLDEILEKYIGNDDADGGDDGEVGGILTVVDEGEVEGEPKQQVVVVGCEKSVFQEDSEPVHVDEVLLKVVELLLEYLADCQAIIVLLHRTLVHQEIEQECRQKEQKGEDEHEDRPVPSSHVHHQFSQQHRTYISHSQ